MPQSQQGYCTIDYVWCEQAKTFWTWVFNTNCGPKKQQQNQTRTWLSLNPTFPPFSVVYFTNSHRSSRMKVDKASLIAFSLWKLKETPSWNYLSSVYQISCGFITLNFSKPLFLWQNHNVCHLVANLFLHALFWILCFCFFPIFSLAGTESSP